MLEMEEKYGYERLRVDNVELFNYMQDVEVLGFDLAQIVNEVDISYSRESLRRRMLIIKKYFVDYMRSGDR